MAPAGPGKRKRGDRSYSGDGLHEGQRPSPHRPGNLNLAQQNQQSQPYDRDFSGGRGRPSKRGSRGGGRGGHGHSNANSPEVSQQSPKTKSPEPVDRIVTNGGRIDSPMPPVIVTAPEPEPQTPPEPKPFAYEYVPDETCATWSEEGRNKVFQVVMEAIQDSDDLKIAAVCQELVQSALMRRIPADEIGQVMRRMADEEATTAGDAILSQSAFLDSISICAENEILPASSIYSLRQVLQSSGISADVLRQELDAPLLEKLGLIRNTFARMAVRKQTNVLYRQANFNLMREESEGFAKLMTELFTTTSTEPPSAEVVEESLERVKAMIGAFDLDVGRTLDVVLDVFGAVLIKQFRFFVKFLRASPWWPTDHKVGRDANKCTGMPLWALPGNSSWYLNDEQKKEVAHQARLRDKIFWSRAREVGLQAFYEVGRMRASEEDIKKANLQQTDTISLDDQWIKQTKTLPPVGNRDAAQLLGFKLRFYSSSPARDDDDKLPDNLIYLSALLIKVGFISLKDLYLHLWRSDEEMEALRLLKIKEKAEKERETRPGASGKNALLMAGALVDDTIPIPSRLRDPATRSGTPSKEVNQDKSTATPAVSTTEPLDQKVSLLKSLLAVGAIPEALFILGCFPWIIDLYPDIPEYINRFIHYSLDGVYSTIQPMSDRTSLQFQKPVAETDVAGLLKGQVRLSDAPTNKVLRWAHLDRADSGDGSGYRFYWDEWNDNIPVCQTIDDVFVLCGTLLNIVGVRVGQDSGLLTKFARIGRDSLKNDPSDRNRQRWADLSKRVLLPALSFTKSNAGVVNEVFDLISVFPINVRYLMYLEWSAGRTSRLPELKGAFDQAKAETKDVLKRISKTNVKPMARSLAKIAFANPHIVITTAMSQIEVYDAIAEVFVEGARYFTDLGYDVLTWAMISSMARAGRSRTQESGLFTSKWLTALASFAGKVFKRYKLMKPGPVLEYVAEQLEHGNLTDLIMLEQIVLSMAGITTDTNYNDAQLQAMGGGPNLRSQTILQLLDRRHESSITSMRLMKSLHETKLTGKLLVAMAQQRQACIYNPENVSAPLKLLGNIFDEIDRIMVQYLDLLRSKLTAEEFRSAVPDTAQLLFDYQLCPEVAFSISRPLIRLRILEFDKEEADRKKEDGATPKAISNGDEEMTDQVNGISEEDGETLEDSTPDGLAGATATDAEISGTTLNVEDMEKEAGPAEAEEISQPGKWHPVLKELMDSLGQHLPNEVTETIGLGFFTTFWQLSLYDIAVAGKSYDDEVTRLKAKMKAITADRTDTTSNAMRKKEAEKKQVEILCEKLMIENREHIKASGVLKKRLDIEKTQWFAGKSRIYSELNTALMEHCFLPRLLCSPIDSYFCFKFVKYLHSSGASNFRTLGFYDLIFRQDRLVSLVFACTSKEADNFGRFLNEVLRDLGRWHQTKGVYEREAFGSKRDLVGFAMKVDGGKPALLLDFESFRRILFKWHQNVFAALNSCLSASEYMHVRNAISVLRSISLHFPVINYHGTALRKSMEALGDSDKDDLRLSSKAIMGALNRREKAWVMPQAFRKGQEKGGSFVEADPSRATTPQNGGKLSAAAPEFKPNDSQSPAGKKSDENGDLKDTVMTDVTASNSASEKVEVEGENNMTAPNSAKTNPSATTSTSARVETLPVIGANAQDQLPDRGVNGDNKDAGPTGPPSAADSSRRHELPRRVSPVRSLRPSPSLPSRPEPGDHRNIRRNDAHIPPRPPYGPDSQRPVTDGRPQNPQGRHGRSDERPREAEFERPVPYSRSHERDDRMAPSRGDYGRGSERDSSLRYPPERGSTRPQSRDIPGPLGQETRSERSRPLPEPRNDRERAMEPRPSERPASSSSAPSQPAAVVINPERAALINADLNPRPDMSIRGQARDRPTRDSRPTSPRPSEDRRHPSRQDRHEDARHVDRRSEVNSHQARSTFGPSSPSGPRSHRQDRPDRSRPPVDMQHGRLEQEPTQTPQTANLPHDRPTESEIPSGPRSRGSISGPRGRGELQQPPINAQVPSMPSSDRSIPTGPSARSHARTASHHDLLSSGGASSPTTPATDTVGLHPSRAHLVAPTSSAEAPGQAPQSREPPPSILTSPPAGPRGGNAPANAPSGPSPTTRVPPSGPHDNSARSNRNNRHPITAVNNTLVQAGQGPSGRGRSMRQNSGQITHNMGPPTPTVGNGPGPRLDTPSSSQPDGRRVDLFSLNQNGGPALPNGQGPQNSSSEHSNNDRSGPTRPAPTDRRTDLTEARGEGGRQASLQSNRARTPERDERRDGHRGDRDHDRNGTRDHRNEQGGSSSRDSSSRHGDPSSMPQRRSGRGQEQESDSVSGRPPNPDDRGDRRGGYDRGGRPQGDGPPPRKHGREGEGPPYPGPGGGRGGGMRNASENKRPRRGA